ncbi:coiled-coil domain-containing protein 93 [Rhopalosiphum maidis]|uniref:coiled-coil domain-containing protein 93 n=1 Tax=Rhopalosiphum maidis TaxID=43146 RepID=UPI000EFF7EBB|nr:coiled-coil domain-containing protein 93 [Rhopalosiphum maidis]
MAALLSVAVLFFYASSIAFGGSSASACKHRTPERFYFNSLDVKRFIDIWFNITNSLSVGSNLDILLTNLTMSLREVFKPKSLKISTTFIDADGREKQIETREDEEQSQKLQEIIDLLIAAGYFRARIKGLSPFDKIVGGLTWCIDNCNVDLDIDLHFDESLVIGQKIALTEKIVSVLPKMKCPYQIEPHQIQGLDYIHVFPVIQWLVKRSIEKRKERGEFLMVYAANQFDKLNCFKNVQECEPKRKEKCLYLKKCLTGNRTNKSFHKEEQRIMECIDDISEPENIESCEWFIKKPFDANDFIETVMTDEEKITKLKEENLKLVEELAQAQEETKRIETKIEKINLQNDNMGDDRRREHEKIKILLTEYERVKETEETFQKECEIKMEEYQKKIKETNALLEEPVEDNTELKEELDNIRNMVEAARTKLSKKARAVGLMKRKLDQIPDRAELAQYQRRFVELSNEVSARYRETKRHYALYNTLSDVQMYLNKELSLLSSILDAYPEAEKSPESKEQFLRQLENIDVSVKQTLDRVENKRNKEQSIKSNLNNQLSTCMSAHRQYLAAVKELETEVQKNLQLQEQIDQL